MAMLTIILPEQFGESIREPNPMAKGCNDAMPGWRLPFFALCVWMLFSCPDGMAGTASEVPTKPARIVPLNQVPTLEVDGFPFLLVGAQCDIWRSTRQDEKTVAFFDGYAAMNATTVSVGIPWSKIEPTRDHYDLQFLDWFVKQARQRRLKLILNLFLLRY